MEIGTKIWFISSIVTAIASIISLQIIPELMGFFVGMMMFSFIVLPITFLIIENAESGRNTSLK